MADFEQELRECFLDEATQMVSDAEQCFLALETRPDDPEIIDQLFRLAHNLKGGGNGVGFLELGAFMHSLESMLLRVKKRELPVTRPVIDLLLKSNDHLQRWLGALRADHGAVVESAALVAEVKAQTAGAAAPVETPLAAASVVPPKAEPPTSAPSAEPPQASAFGDVPLAAEFAEPPPAAVAPAPPAPAQPHAAKPADESIRVSLARLDKLLTFVGELVILHSVLKEQGNAANPAIRKTIIQLGKATKSVQDVSMSLRMIPIKQSFQKMQRIVRDTSASLGKMINLKTEGESTEVDKTILEALGDPLMHLVRNACDHGIESMEGRMDAGKDPEGEILLRAFHQSGNLVIEIKDNGGGMDPARLRAKAVEKGIIAPTASLSDAEAYLLIFAPGFSTKAEVTDISGRGVGMDVVKTNIDAISGTIEIDTELGRGTCFRITLPLTLAIIDGMIVRCGMGRYVVPLTHVHETIRPAANDVHFVTGVGPVFNLRGENLPLFHLDNLLQPGLKSAPKELSTAIVVRGQTRAFAVMVDDIVGQAQVVIKQLGLEHRNLRGFSGSAILGDGMPALILELEDLSLRALPQAVKTRSAA